VYVHGVHVHVVKCGSLHNMQSAAGYTLLTDVCKRRRVLVKLQRHMMVEQQKRGGLAPQILVLSSAL
jgi:hypothetical protein